MISFIKYPQNTVCSGNDIEVIVKSEYYSSSYLTGTKVYLTVINTDNSIFCKLSASPDTDGYANFNLIDLLIKDQTVNYFLSTNVFQTVHLPSFRLEIYETAWNNDIIQTSTTVSNSFFYVIQGGIAKELLPFCDSSLLDYFLYHKSFLSWQGNTQYVSPEQIVKLYYLHNSDIPTRKLRINKDGVLTYITLNLYNYSFLLFDISQYFENTKVVKIAICNSSNEQINEEITYIIDNSYYIRQQTFVFKNSFGLLESVSARGMQSTTHEPQRNIYSKNLTAIATSSGDLYVQRTGLKKTIETEIGFVSEDDTERMIDFLNSDVTYLLTNGKLVPISILTEEVTLQNDELNGLYTMPFQWKYNFNEKFVGKMLPNKYSDSEYTKPILVNESKVLLIDDNTYFTWS